MLKRVSIKGFLFIEDAELEFTKGFNVITGETGAGKSILLGALNVCLGGKIPKDIINSRADHFRVSLTFDLSEQPILREKVRAQVPASSESLDESGEVTFLTLLTKKGELHYFINNIPVTAARLMQLAEFLVDIHSQRQNQYLLKNINHIYFFDSFLGMKEERARYSKAYKKFREVEEKITTLYKQQETLSSQKDFLKFTEAELAEHLTDETDYEGLKRELKVLERQEKLSQHLFTFEDAARSALKNLSDASSALKKVIQENKGSAGSKGSEGEPSQYSSLNEQIQEQTTILEEKLMAVTSTINRTDTGAKVDILQKQLAGLEALEKKHGANLSSLKEKYQEVAKKLEFLENCEAELVELKEHLVQFQGAVLTEGYRLHQKRLAGIAPFEAEFKSELAALGMESGRLLVSFKPDNPEKLTEATLVKRLQASGYDRLEFLYASAKEMGAKPLRDIASGGELSRMMLALKALLSERIMIGTMIFDEIDAGVGGLTAGRLAEKIRILSRDRQIIVITHLPQVARVATQHFRIEKLVTSEGTTETQIRLLKGKALVAEVCRMLGRNPTPENLNFAGKFIEEDT